ncbi:heme-binding protein [uncultured Bilophila sp.]|uniref:GlcG/HbpS family heme-binding protein n=1 Tax=uncultured Bilophila sp. TaxID=529385 RepID=UPI00280AD52E|nr:heme-binding protein [uncultured Bilophila sp.]
MPAEGLARRGNASRRKGNAYPEGGPGWRHAERPPAGRETPGRGRARLFSWTLPSGCPKARGGAPVCLAIVNRSGRLAALLSMDGTPERAVPIAQGKAYTALRMESSTKDFHERLLRERLTIADFCDPAFTTLEGGIPFFDGNGKCVGGLGISGRKPAEDGELAGRLGRILMDLPNDTKR